MPVRKDLNEIRDQAAGWTTWLDSGDASETKLLEFHRWCENPLHARALSECRALLAMIQELPKSKTSGLTPSPPAQRRFPSLARLFDHPMRFSAAALALAVLVAVGVWLNVSAVREFATQTYTTGTGEHRTVLLKDGSLAHLNTQSRIRWMGSGKDRRVALEKGEVLFEVAHDPTRPFRVTVGNSEIRDLATEFDVYRKSNGSVVVTVLSGQVAVKELVTGGGQPAWTERLLRPNQQIEYTQANLIADVHPVSARKAVLWRDQLLVTEGQSVATVVGELNRYSTKPILLADPRLDKADINIGGALDIHDVGAALERIQRLQPTVVVTDTGDSYVLTYKGDAISGVEHSNAPQQPSAGRP
jgi:transmembrane sensor